MRTYLRDALHTQYAIGDAHGGIAVRHQHDGTPPLGEIVDRSEDHRLVIGVKTARRLVEQHQIGVAKEHAGQSDTLLLTLRKAATQLADLRIQAVRQRIDQFERGRLGESFAQYGIGNVVREIRIGGISGITTSITAGITTEITARITAFTAVSTVTTKSTVPV